MEHRTRGNLSGAYFFVLYKRKCDPANVFLLLPPVVFISFTFIPPLVFDGEFIVVPRAILVFLIIELHIQQSLS